MKPRKLLTLLLAVAVFFTNITLMSTSVSATLLPIKNISAQIQIKDFSSSELNAVPVEYLLKNMVYGGYYTDEDGVHHSYGDPINIADDATVAISMGLNSNQYKVYSRTDTIDFSKVSSYTYCTIIVGSAKQLDPDNVKYTVYCRISEKYYTAEHDISFYIPPAEEGGERTIPKTEVYDAYGGRYTSNDDFDGYRYYYSTVWEDLAEGAQVYVDITPKLYMYIGGELVPQENIRSEITYTNSTYEGGMLANNNRLIAAIKYYSGDELVYTERLTVYLYPNRGIGQDISLWYKYNDIHNYVVNTSTSTQKIDDDNVPITQNEYKLFGDYYIDDEYVFQLDIWYGNSGNEINDNIVKIVEGKYTTLEDAVDAPDIKDNLMATYLNDSPSYCFMDEKTFTVFYRFDEEDFIEGIGKDENTSAPLRKYAIDIEPFAFEDEVYFSEIGTVESEDKTIDTDTSESGTTETAAIIETAEPAEDEESAESSEAAVTDHSDESDVQSESAEAEDITTTDEEVKVARFSVKVTGEKRPVEPEEPSMPKPAEISSDPISISSLMSVYGAKSASTFSVYSSLDSYYIYGYQTLFALGDDDSAIDLTNVNLYVDADDRANIYDAVGSNKVDFENEPQNFSNGSVQYTVSAGTVTSNFFVNVVTQTEGAKLYVNGPSEREIYFDDYYGNYHDILIANIGAEALTGLKAELTNAVNVKLDGYWNIGGEKNDTLAGFTTTYSNERANLAKVRLVPNGDGEISGELTITADGQEPVVIELKGRAGNPKIVTVSPIVDGVKYVPYFAIIATDNIHEWNKVSYTLNGYLPEGLDFNRDTGEIYGVPQESGSFTFTVSAVFSNNRYTRITKTFDLNILDNTNENVFKASDEGYDIITSIGAQGKEYDFRLSPSDVESDQLFVSNGEYGQFADMWLNGVRLIPDEDYTSEAGSTRVTIKAQTLQKLTRGNANTIAAEFRVNGNENKELRRTAQNFVIVQPGSSSGNNRPGGSSSDSSGSSRPGGSSGGSGSSVGSGVNTSVPAVTPSGASTWEEIEKELRAKPDGGTFEITMRSSNIVPENIVKLAASKNTLLKVTTGANITWLFDCAGITRELKPSIGQVLVSIPDSVLQSLSGAAKNPLRIDNADFGKSEKLIYNVGATFAGQYANLYSYDTSLKYIGSYPIAADGTATMNISNSGRYVIAVDDHTHLAGDMDNSCTLDARDGVMILRYIVGMEELPFVSKADVNYDGRVNAFDVAFLLKMIVL